MLESQKPKEINLELAESKYKDKPKAMPITLCHIVLRLGHPCEVYEREHASVIPGYKK